MSRPCRAVWIEWSPIISNDDENAARVDGDHHANHTGRPVPAEVLQPFLYGAVGCASDKLGRVCPAFALEGNRDAVTC